VCESYRSTSDNVVVPQRYRGEVFVLVWTDVQRDGQAVGLLSSRINQGACNRCLIALRFPAVMAYRR